MESHPEPARGTEGEVVGRRIAATLIDTLVVFAVYYAGLLAASGLVTASALGALSVANYLVWFVVSVFGLSALLSLHGSSWLWFLTAVLTWAGYATVCETVRGQTVGKLLTGIVVVRNDGSPCDAKGAAVRNLFRLVDGLLYYFVGLLAIGFSSDSQRLGDRAADTRVVKTRDRE